MLGDLSILIFVVAYCVALTEWGSRVMTENNGRVHLTFKGSIASVEGANTMPTFTVYERNGNQSVVTIDGAECKRDGRIWGACSYLNDTTTIEVPNVKQVKQIVLVADFDPIKSVDLIARFAPCCQFEAPTKDGVLFNESVPFSRFVKGQSSVTLTFGAEGSTSQVFLHKNAVLLCEWKGTKLVTKNATTECGEDLVINRQKNARIFTNNFPPPTTANKLDFYKWSTATALDGVPRNEEFVSITVDGNQSGDAGEVEKCKDLLTTSVETAEDALAIDDNEYEEIFKKALLVPNNDQTLESYTLNRTENIFVSVNLNGLQTVDTSCRDIFTTSTTTSTNGNITTSIVIGCSRSAGSAVIHMSKVHLGLLVMLLSLMQR